MLSNQPLLHLARVTVETLSPLSIGTGRGSALFDVQVVTDANGLPAIPGTSLAGVLRHALRERLGESGEDVARFLFGYAEGDEGTPSALTVTWGHIHDSDGRVVDGPDLKHAWTRDPLLSEFTRAALPHRDHVRLDHRGAAAKTERGKFDRSFVPVGHRFGFEMALSDTAEGLLGGYWTVLKELLASPGFRLGGATRRGYGALKVVSLAGRGYDLRNAADFDAYCAHPVRLNAPHELPEEPKPGECAGPWLRLELELTPEDFWRFGAGDWSPHPGKPADALPYTEECITGWPDDPKPGSGDRPDGPRPNLRLVVPASGIKGALSHRLAYHDNRLAGRYADQAESLDELRSWSEENPAVRALFGHARETGDGSGKDTGKAGAVLIDDVVLPLPKSFARLAHNGIDRFTGGVRDGVLFTEEAVWGGGFRLSLRIGAKAWKQAEDRTREAFAATVRDLLEGRLELGAAGAKGHGVFTGKILYSEIEALQP